MTDAVLSANPVTDTDELDSPARRARRRLFKRKAAVAGLVVMTLFIGLALLAPLIVPYDPVATSWSLVRKPPTAQHWFGTDELGRDELSRVLYAGQISLEIGVAVAALSTLVGTVVGAVAGFVGKTTDEALMRITDLFLVLPALALLAVVLERFGHDRLTIILVLAALFWMYVARVVRAQVLAVKEQDYIEAARASGASGPWIVWRHVLPNCVGPIVVNATLAVAAAIVAESALSFLGFGVQLPATSWGRMLADAEGFIGTSQAYLLYFPGMAILITILAVNFVGDGLRDAFDPRSS